MEVHKSQWNNGLWYRVGAISGTSILWGGNSVNYDTGYNPSVALNSNNRLIEVHEGNSQRLFYRVATIYSNTLFWGTSTQYDTGNNPSVASDGQNTVVEVHQGGSNLYYRVGTLSGNAVSWGTSTQYTTGNNPTVAVTASGVVIESHHSDSNVLYSRVGQIQGNTILWTSTSAYDSGKNVSVATNGNVAIQTHLDQGLGNTVWFSTSLIVNRADWMHNNMPYIRGKTLADIAIPGAHDAGMYKSSNSYYAGWAEAQDLTLYQQLYTGIRYFDLRPAANSGDLYICHGDGSLRCYADQVSTVLADVARFMQEGHSELVILKFSHADFTGDSAGYTRLKTMISKALGNWLYTADFSGQLSDLSLNELIGTQGRVLVVYDGNDAILNPTPGIFYYRDYNASYAAEGDLRVYDNYADSSLYDTMASDQKTKFQGFKGLCSDNTTPCDLFLFSWTLTPFEGNADTVASLARTADANLGDVLSRWSPTNAYGKRMNILYTDFVEYSRSTDMCLYLNQLAN